MESSGQSKIQSKKLRLAEAIVSGRLYQTKMILDDNPNLNYIDDQGLSPLVRAFMIEDEKYRTRVAMVKLLLQHKADVNFQDNQGKHALNWVCSVNMLDMVKLLLERCLQDIDLTSQDIDGNTPLMYAVKHNNITMVQLLVNVMRKFSLTVDQRNHEDRTAYYEAVEMGFEECANILSNVGKASRGIKVNPFLDFLGFTNAVEHSGDGVRVRSASPVKDCARHGVGQGKRVGNRRKSHTSKNDERNRNGFSHGRKREGNRLRRSGKVHSEVISRSIPGDNIPGENITDKIPRDNIPGDIPKNTKLEKGKEESRNMKRREKNTNRCREGATPKAVVVLQDDSAPAGDNSRTDGGELDETKYEKISPENANSSSRKQERFLQLILGESGGEAMSRPSHTPVSGISTNPVSRSVSPANETQGREGDRKDVQKRLGTVCHTQQTTVSEKIITNQDYYSYLEWKASLNSPTYCLRNLLALRAEQQSEISSYRKGHALRKYDVSRTDELLEDTSADVVTSVSERGTERSEAARKISAVAKTVGLTLYLTNRQRNNGRTQSGLG